MFAPFFTASPPPPHPHPIAQPSTCYLCCSGRCWPLLSVWHHVLFVFFCVLNGACLWNIFQNSISDCIFVHFTTKKKVRFLCRNSLHDDVSFLCIRIILTFTTVVLSTWESKSERMHHIVLVKYRCQWKAVPSLKQMCSSCSGNWIHSRIWCWQDYSRISCMFRFSKHEWAHLGKDLAHLIEENCEIAAILCIWRL